MLPKTPSVEFPYEVERMIGEGAMGQVFRALEPSLGRPVAIKTLHPNLLSGLSESAKEEILGRFLQEAKAAASLSHPGVTTIYRVGSVNGMPYIVMEWLEGLTLEEILAEQAPVPESLAAQLGIELLDALDAAHRAGIVHRDVKPANLVVVSDGRLKVTDFGIARVQGSDLVKTQAGAIVGTPLYSSPEQFLGQPTDGRSDIFAAGVILYYALTANYPFPGDSPLAIAQSVLNVSPAPPRQFNSDISPEMSAIVLQALARERSDRHASASAMADALRALTSSGSGLSIDVTSAGLQTRVSHIQPATAMTGSPNVIRDLSRNPARMIISVIKGWNGRKLPNADVQELIHKLEERPVHAPPFAGAIIVDDVCVLLCDGLLLGAVFTSTGESGDSVLEHLPERCDVELYTVPNTFNARIVASLSSLLNPPVYTHQDLDATFVNIPALASKLEEEKFHGTLTLKSGDNIARILFIEGQQVLKLFSRGWDNELLTRPWQSWISTLSVKASVEQLNLKPARQSYRHDLRNHTIDLAVLPEISGHLCSTCLSLTTETVPFITREQLIDSDRAHALLRWMTSVLPGFFEERTKTGEWKYLAEWLGLIKKAIAHHDLQRPKSKETDFFDLVTFDGSDKALHLVHVVPEGTKLQLERFIERAIAAKTARIKTGDVGGAILLAPSFTEDALAFYNDSIKEKSKGGLLSKFQKSVTGYEGFIRLGSRRGFHLLLVVADDNGHFHPVIHQG